MKVSRIMIGLGFLCLTALPAAFAQETAVKVQEPILHAAFEEGVGSWGAVGNGAAVSITHEPLEVKEGKGALKFKYEVNKGGFSILLLSTPEGKLEKANSFKFWVKPDISTTLALSLQEQDGGRYACMFSVRKDVWQQVEIGIGDLVLDQSADAPKDPNGVLDMDHVVALALLDVSQLFAQAENLSAIFPVKTGSHTLFLDDFSASETFLPSSSNIKNGVGAIDLYNRNQIAWTTLGDIQLEKNSSGKPLEGTALQMRYRQQKGKPTGIAKSLLKGSLVHAGRLQFDAASEKPLKLIVQFEEKSGGKYNATVNLPGGSLKTTFDIPISDFKVADDSKDDNGKLDLDSITQMLIIDASGFLDAVEGDNKLWLSPIKIAK